MRLLPLLPLFSLVALTLALPVPEAPTISALQDRDLTLIDGRATGPVEFYDERSVGSDSFDERAFEDDYAVEERDFEPDYDVEERDFDESPLDLELRSEGEPVQQPSLYRKDAGDQVEPRMAGAIIQGAQALAEGVMAIVKLIKGKVAKEKEVRRRIFSSCVKGLAVLTEINPDAKHLDPMAHCRGPEEDRQELERARYSPQA
jgi:hypothetical protein